MPVEKNSVGEKAERTQKLYILVKKMHILVEKVYIFRGETLRQKSCLKGHPIYDDDVDDDYDDDVDGDDGVDGDDDGGYQVIGESSQDLSPQSTPTSRLLSTKDSRFQ